MKEEEVITRDDGSQVKIVAQLMHGRGLHESIDTYVLRRESENDDWKYCSDQIPDISKMTPTQVREEGHSEKFMYASVPEVIRVIAKLKGLYNESKKKNAPSPAAARQGNDLSP